MLSKLFGSDVYLAYTAAYTWQSNQTAHTMMGFMGTTLLTMGAITVGLSPLYGLSFLAIPLSKDISDLIVDRARAQSGSGVKYFPVRMRELISDALTDTFFWSLGMVLALAIILKIPVTDSQQAATIFIILFGVMLVVGIAAPGLYYVREKTAFDRAGLPYYFRLPNFDGKFHNAEDAELILNFLNTSDRNEHLIIHGPHGARKTTLAVGIGSGLTVARRMSPKATAVRYVTAARLIEELAISPGRQSNEDEPHSIFNAKVLIVDDLSHAFTAAPQSGGGGNNIPAQLWDEILAKPIIWVVSDEADVPAWETWLGAHLPATMELKTIALEPVDSLPVTQQYSILKLQWQGLFPFLGLAIPIALGAAAIWALYWGNIPNSPFLRFAGFGLAIALIAEIVWFFIGKRKTE